MPQNATIDVKLIEGENSRWCLTCDTLKHFDKFHKKEGCKYGYLSQCKECRSTIDRQKRHYRNLDKRLRTIEIEWVDGELLMETFNSKICSVCSNLLPYSKYNFSSASPDDRQYTCKRCKHTNVRITKLLNNSIERNYEEFRDKLNQSKFCTKCDEYKPFGEFYRKHNGKYNLTSACKSCTLKKSKKYQEENDRSTYQREYMYDRYNNDNSFRLKSSIASRLRLSLKNGYKSKSTEELLGCTIEELWQHLEDQFEDGMTRDNQGEWHVDHEIPCSKFDMDDPKQRAVCWHYSNLQPLWAEDNISKRNNIIGFEDLTIDKRFLNNYYAE